MGFGLLDADRTIRQVEVLVADILQPLARRGLAAEAQLQIIRYDEMVSLVANRDNERLLLTDDVVLRGVLDQNIGLLPAIRSI